MTVANWGEERPVDSKHYELTCQASTLPERLRTDFSWWIKEDGTSKRIPSYADRTEVPSGLNRYAVSSPFQSTLVIERVMETDLTTYTCDVLVAGIKRHNESVRLVEKRE